MGKIHFKNLYESTLYTGFNGENEMDIPAFKSIKPVNLILLGKKKVFV